MSAELRIGVSGWLYPRWRGKFYPPGLPHKRELAYAANCFSSIELNGSFYSLQRPESFQRWYNETPDGFVFAVKGSRYVTHMLKLKGIDAALANFFAQGVLALQEKLGPVLWQFPERVQFDAEKFSAFFERLPCTRRQAARVGKQHDYRIDGRTYLAPIRDGPVRHCVEVRHPSFACDEALALFRAHDIALVVSDTAGKFVMLDHVTADFVYVRLHGSTHLYHSRYTDTELRAWADRIAGWRRHKRDVYVYFDNDAKVHAPFDAQRLMALMGRAATGIRRQ